MNTLGDKLRVKRVKGDMGIEIELSGERLPGGVDLAHTLWRRDVDGSIKGAVDSGEYVLRSPVKINEVDKVLHDLDNAFINHKTKIVPNITTGTHVHVNVQDLTPAQLISYVCCYLIVEELMVDWCHPSRKGNHFCLRAIDAEYLVRLLIEAIEHDNIRMLETEDIRYSSINLLSLFKYGSVEFRALEGTNDFDKLRTWCNMLYKLKQNSLQFKSPKHVYEKISGEGSDAFLSRLLGEYAHLLKTVGWQRKIRNGIVISQDIAFARDWDQLNLNVFRPNQKTFS